MKMISAVDFLQNRSYVIYCEKFPISLKTIRNENFSDNVHVILEYSFSFCKSYNPNVSKDDIQMFK